MSYQLCRHIRTNGRRCKSPSLTGNIWCYFHQHLHQSHQGFRHTEATRGYLVPGQHLELNTLEDRESVQLALSVVINALATGQLDSKRAGTLLYGLQVASNNAANLDSRPGPDAVRSVGSSPEGLALAEPAMNEVTPFDPYEDDYDDEDEDDDDRKKDNHESDDKVEENVDHNDQQNNPTIPNLFAYAALEANPLK